MELPPRPLLALCAAAWLACAAACAEAAPRRGTAELIQELKAADWSARLLAAEALRDRGPAAAEAAGALAECMEDREARVREAAAEALGAIGGAAMPELLRLVRHEQYEIRAAAAKALGHAGPGAVPALAAALKDAQPFVRQRAAEGLAVLGPRAQSAFAAVAEAFNRTGEDAWVRCALADALGAQGPLAKDAAPMLVQALYDPDAALRFHAVWALGEIGPAGKALPQLLPLLKDEDFEVRAAVADVLGLFGAEGLPPLRGIVQDRTSELRLMAVGSLADVGSAAVEDLEALQDDADPEIAQAARTALGKALEHRAWEQRRRMAWSAGLLLALGCAAVAAWWLRRNRAVRT